MRCQEWFWCWVPSTYIQAGDAEQKKLQGKELAVKNDTWLAVPASTNFLLDVQKTTHFQEWNSKIAQKWKQNCQNVERISSDSRMAEGWFRETVSGQAVRAVLKQWSPHMAKKARWTLVLPHCLPFLKGPGWLPKGKLVICHSVMWLFLLRCQRDTPIVCSPSCPLWLIPSDPNFLSHLWTENNKQGVEGVYHGALHPPGCSPHTEAMLAREKTVRNLTAGLAGVVHLHEHPQFQSVRESSRGMRGSHFYTTEPQNLLSVDKPQIRGNLSNLKINKQ